MKDKKLLAILATPNNHSALISAGYSLSDLRAAGYSASALDEYERDIERIPILDKPYSQLWDDIQAKRRLFRQSDWGPETCPPEKNICNTPMCTAGNLINMAGPIAYEMKNKYGWPTAASMVHQRSTSSHLPQQNYGSIPDEWALAFIEMNAEKEKN